MWTGREDTISIVANGVDHILNGINRPGCEYNVLRLYSMDGIEVCIEKAS